MVKAVAVAIRKTADLPSQGCILEVGLATLDMATGDVLQQDTWLMSPPNLHTDPTLLKLAAAIGDSASEVGRENFYDNILTVALREGRFVTQCTNEMEKWWKDNVGTERWTPMVDRPLTVGFAPDVARAWLQQHIPILAEKLGVGMDFASIIWALDLDYPEPEPRVEGELKTLSDLVGYVGRKKSGTQTIKPVDLPLKKATPTPKANPGIQRKPRTRKATNATVSAS